MSCAKSFFFLLFCTHIYCMPKNTKSDRRNNVKKIFVKNSTKLVHALQDIYSTVKTLKVKIRVWSQCPLT